MRDIAPTNYGSSRKASWRRSEVARLILLSPAPIPARDKPLASRSLRPRYIFPPPPLWIPAFAGMTDGGPDWRSDTSSQSKPRNVIFVPITHPGWAGTPRYENRGTGWRALRTVPRYLGWVPDRRGAGDKPRATFLFFRLRTTMSGKKLAGWLFSYQSPIPAGAGTPRYEKPELRVQAANSHRGFCHSPPPAPAGDSPRATFPSPPSWIPAFAGMTGNPEGRGREM